MARNGKKKTQKQKSLPFLNQKHLRRRQNFLGKGGELPHRANVSFLGHSHIDLGGSNIDAR
jgi:hypothetical protein